MTLARCLCAESESGNFCIYAKKHKFEFFFLFHNSKLTDGLSDCSQSSSLEVCEVDEELVTKLKSFRFRKGTNNAAIVSELLC